MATLRRNCSFPIFTNKRKSEKKYFLTGARGNLFRVLARASTSAFRVYYDEPRCIFVGVLALHPEQRKCYLANLKFFSKRSRALFRTSRAFTYTPSYPAAVSLQTKRRIPWIRTRAISPWRIARWIKPVSKNFFVPGYLRDRAAKFTLSRNMLWIIATVYRSIPPPRPKHSTRPNSPLVSRDRGYWTVYAAGSFADTRKLASSRPNIFLAATTVYGHCRYWTKREISEFSVARSFEQGGSSTRQKLNARTIDDWNIRSVTVKLKWNGLDTKHELVICIQGVPYEANHAIFTLFAIKITLCTPCIYFTKNRS